MPLSALPFPDSFPVFPLTGALLLPGGKLPLNIFEQRYLALVDDALAAGRMFGMIQPDPVLADGANGPALYRVGCLGRLVSFSETEDGRYLITLLGVARFQVVEELPMRQGYRRVQAHKLPFAAGLAADRFDRAGLLAALRPFFTRHGMDVNWDSVERMPLEALITTLAMVCPFDPAEKQALLECDGVEAQAAALVTLLRMDAYAIADVPHHGFS